MVEPPVGCVHVARVLVSGSVPAYARTAFDNEFRRSIAYHPFGPWPRLISKPFLRSFDPAQSGDI
jgi:hypothetical protein